MSHLLRYKCITICDDHPICYYGLEFSLKKIFAHETDFVWTKTGKALLESAQAQEPDLIVLDLKLPDKPGLEVLKELDAMKLKSRIVVMTACDQASVLRQVLNHNVHALLWKTYSEENLASVLETIAGEARTRAYLDPEIKSFLESTPGAVLTPREDEVTNLLVKGHTNPEIASILGCSTETIKTHRANIMRKTGAANRAELNAWYLQGRSNG
jgi:two-component system response regulator FimZ (fimbrial Z protein)